ncbi:septum formation initiator family protein [Selenihalanaerobacter shriftii]|uniref:septum formation initiator family protein n=1 Tax=Selenihalanaerobacter shriftii TaxID=142842 RepID=UPI000999C708|nr:cell division protein FtsL [Selenihalanaerobacter shriftii]
MIVVDKKKEVKDYKRLNSTARKDRNTKKKRVRKQRSNKQKNNSNTLLFMSGYALIILIIVIFGILYINKYVEMNKINLQMNQVQSKIKDLEEEKQKLKLNLSQYKSLDRIENIAKVELGMVEPKQVKYISMNSKNGTSLKQNQDLHLNDRLVEISKLGEKVSTWLQGFSQVEAGTLNNE